VRGDRIALAIASSKNSKNGDKMFSVKNFTPLD
jgi:hypothetical protein